MKQYIEDKILELKKELDIWVFNRDKEKGEQAKGKIMAYEDILNRFCNE